MPYADPEQKKAHNRAYREANRARLAARKREWYRDRYRTDQEFREREKAAANAARPAYAARAYMAVQRALKAGTLTRPERCEKCSEPAFVEAAHDDYSRPLAVRWLCRPCHRREDRANPKRTRRV